MTKWILFAVSLIGFATMYGTRSPVLVFFGMVVGGGCMIGGILKWMDERIGGVSRSQTYIPSAEEVQILRRMHDKRMRPTKPVKDVQISDSSKTT